MALSYADEPSAFFFLQKEKKRIVRVFSPLCIRMPEPSAGGCVRDVG